MRTSHDNLEADLEERSGLQHGPPYVHAAPGNSDECLVSVSLAGFTGIEDVAVWLTERAEGELAGDTLGALIAAGRTSQEAGFAGLAQDGGDAGRGGECVGGGDAVFGRERFDSQFSVEAVDVLGDIGADINAHAPLRALTTVRRSARAVAVPHGDQSQSLIGGRCDLALPGALLLSHQWQPA